MSRAISCTPLYSFIRDSHPQVIGCFCLFIVVRAPAHLILFTLQNISHYSTMARFFREQDIDEYRECFYLFARSGQIRTVDELTVIMRSLGTNVTINELNKYYRDKGGKISFADFLDVMHQHHKQEDVPKEIVDAFRAYDTSGRGLISANDLRHVLSDWGERLSATEADQLFREANVPANGSVKYEDFVRLLTAPAPDYY